MSHYPDISASVSSRAQVPRVLGRDRFALISVCGDLFDLMKPRIISLLLISTLCPMILASAGQVELSVVLWALLGGTLISGSASAINCIWDRDIDAVMERTKDRPLPAGRISVASATIFALLIGFIGLWVLELHLNRAAAAWALVGHLFYVFVYTMWLKRSTPHNIVIGGAAGAVPPLVGWAAVTGGVDLTALLLFLVVFLWTPPHFWALALNKSGDYARAGVPMLPTVAGEAVTHRHMLWYALSLIPVTALLVWSSPVLGWTSLVGLIGLSGIFSLKVYELIRLRGEGQELKTKKAWEVFGFSLVYLALFFAWMVVDSTVL